MTRGGQLALTRDPVTGAITRDSVGVVATTRLYDPHGVLQRIDLRVGGSAIFSQALVRDSIGRITAAADSGSQGAATTTYRYDVLDRLDQVSVNGTVAQALEYDLAGNRLSRTTNAGTVSATYANDDRLLSVDGLAITHDSAGARRTELTATDSLAYDYDDRLAHTAQLVVQQVERRAPLPHVVRRDVSRDVHELAAHGTAARELGHGLLGDAIHELPHHTPVPKFLHPASQRVELEGERP